VEKGADVDSTSKAAEKGRQRSLSPRSNEAANIAFTTLMQVTVNFMYSFSIHLLVISFLNSSLEKD
jgi:hypothetical protein